MKRTYISISGGLGNQLFQIAAGCFLKHKLGRDVCLVLTDEINTPKKLGINDFLDSLGIDLASIADFENLDLCEFEIDDLSDFLSVPQGVLIFGYFQDWRIVNALEDFAGSLTQSAARSYWVHDFIQSHHNISTVSIHYRLGDYFNNLHALGVLDLEYYKKALLKLNLSSQHELLVFSDSPEKATQLLEGIFPKFTLVDDSGAASPLEILIALGSSGQIVLGNSTFSWCAAYIGNQDKRIAPFPFYRNLPRDFLIPPSWERVGSTFLKTQPNIGKRGLRKLKIFLGFEKL